MGTRLKTFLAIMGATALTVGACVPSTPTLVPTFTPVPRHSRIAFLSMTPLGLDEHRETRFKIEIHTANPGGSDVINLTGSLFGAADTAWSPDGTRVAFRGLSEQGQTWALYIVNADGSHLTRLPSGPGYAQNPAWSPDGSKLLVMAQDGIRVITLGEWGAASISEVLAKGRKPVWSPDGGRIACDWPGSDGQSSIWVMNSDGSNRIELTKGGEPQWSPDGSKIAFGDITGTGLQHNDIFVIDSDGSARTNLTNSPSAAGEPFWSPDGSRIAYKAQYPKSVENIYMMNSDGSGRFVAASFTKGQVSYPSWAPDSSSLAFSLWFSGDREMDGTYVVNVDGSDLRRISVDGVSNGTAWSPWIAGPQ